MAQEQDDEIRVRIDAFTGWFRERIDIVDHLDVPHQSQLSPREVLKCRKPLYIALLEALARARHPQQESSRKRFLKFVDEFSNWTSRDRVSLPHLAAALHRTSEPCFKPLREDVHKRLQGWGVGAPKWVENYDPQAKELLPIWPCEHGEPLVMLDGRLRQENFRHLELLYGFRNYLVHEARQPGLSFEQGEEKPFYEDVTNVSADGSQEWHLVYPVGFMSKLCRECVTAFEEHLVRNNMDPYASFQFGYYLIESLNEPTV